MSSKHNPVIKAVCLGDLTFFEKIAASSFAGLCGALAGNPTDVSLVRF
jgi:hypothetical protein